MIYFQYPQEEAPLWVLSLGGAFSLTPQRVEVLKLRAFPKVFSLFYQMSGGWVKKNFSNIL